MAQTFPASATITGLTIYTSTTVAQNLLGTAVTLRAQLYRSTTPDNIFTPVPGASVIAAPSLTGVNPIGMIASGITTGLSIPVAAGTRGLVVVSATATGASLSQALPMYISTSISTS
jgi:BclB C-terminal domain-containing protein